MKIKKKIPILSIGLTALMILLIFLVLIRNINALNKPEGGVGDLATVGALKLSIQTNFDLENIT